MQRGEGKPKKENFGKDAAKKRKANSAFAPSAFLPKINKKGKILHLLLSGG